jgi:hypothetical protein
MIEQPRFLYVVSEGGNGPIKIGVSARPDNRCAVLQIGNSRKLRLAKTWQMPTPAVAFSIERTIHDDLSEYSVFGEWFEMTEADVIECIDGMMDLYLEQAVQ